VFCLCRAELCKSTFKDWTIRPQICQWGVSLVLNIAFKNIGELENDIVKQTQQVLAGEPAYVRIQ